LGWGGKKGVGKDLNQKVPNAKAGGKKGVSPSPPPPLNNGGGREKRSWKELKSKPKKKQKVGTLRGKGDKTGLGGDDQKERGGKNGRWTSGGGKKTYGVPYGQRKNKGETMGWGSLVIRERKREKHSCSSGGGLAAKIG